MFSNISEGTAFLLQCVRMTLDKRYKFKIWEIRYNKSIIYLFTRYIVFPIFQICNV